MTLTPFTPKRFTDSELFTTEIDDEKFVVKSYLGDDAVLRRGLELRKLKHWRDHDFRVPSCSEQLMDSLSTPHLLIEFVVGVNLSDYLQDTSVAYDLKRARLEQVYTENSSRHRVALAEDDSALIHTDPNTDNILLLDDTHVTIDFEHPTKDKLILEAIAQELANFSRRALTDLGSEHLQDIVCLLKCCYQDQAIVLNKVCEMTLGRNFQFYHRYKDNQKKAKKPGVVTRYDIADALRAELDLSD